MANGVIVESRIQATNIDALNRTAQAQIAVAGGGLVALTASGVQGNEVWTAAAPASGSLGGLWIAYNPSEHLTAVGDKFFAGLSEDPRDYTNLANRPFDCFKPEVGDEIEQFKVRAQAFAYEFGVKKNNNKKDEHIKMGFDFGNKPDANTNVFVRIMNK